MVRCGLLGVLPRILRISARAQPSLTSHSASPVPSRLKKRFFNYRATLRVACRSGRSASSLWRFASHNSFAMSVMFVYGSRHLFAPRRVTLKDQSNQNPGSVSGPTSSGSFVLSLTSHSASSGAIAVEKRFFNYRATLRVACRSGRSASSLWRFASHKGSAMSVMFVYASRHLFAPRRVTLKDQSNQNPGSVSGPTSSGSFALSLIRGSLQRAILGPVQLARRPASHPPDQCQGSAVTYVALCVASATAIKKRFCLCAVISGRA